MSHCQYCFTRAVLLPIPFGIIFILILSLLGLVIYAYFADTRCDPLESGELSTANQVMCSFDIC